MKLEPATVLNTATAKDMYRAIRSRRCEFGLVLVAIAWVLVWYWDTAKSIVAIWERSETFAHGYLIVPISAWLIWRQRQELAIVDLRPNFMVWPLLGLVGFGWLLGQLANASVVQQYCMVSMIPLLVWSILGTQVFRALAFPLFFLLLAVPFGEFLLPQLMERTADFTIIALRLSGIPVYREGLYFTIPSGTWSVIEACSGLRYLIASLTLGFLYAHLTYRSLRRRTLFVAASIIVPIIANWLRAYMIVMIGHLSGMEYAVGADHLIYGWVFFGLVMLILFWVGSRWREDEPVHRLAPVLSHGSRHDESSLQSIAFAALAVAAFVVVWPVGATYLQRPDPGPPVLITPAGDWQPVGKVAEGWQPHFGNPQAELKQDYAHGDSRASLYIGYFRNQQKGAELISSQNTLVDGKGQWHKIGEVHRSISSDNGQITLVESKLQSRYENLIVWQCYWIDGHYTANQYMAKILQAKSQLFGHGDNGAVVIMYTNLDADYESAVGRLSEFTQAMLPAITMSLRHAH